MDILYKQLERSEIQAIGNLTLEQSCEDSWFRFALYAAGMCINHIKMISLHVSAHDIAILSSAIWMMHNSVFTIQSLNYGRNWHLTWLNQKCQNKSSYFHLHVFVSGGPANSAAGRRRRPVDKCHGQLTLERVREGALCTLTAWAMQCTSSNSIAEITILLLLLVQPRRKNVQYYCNNSHLKYCCQPFVAAMLLLTRISIHAFCIQ